MPKPPSPLIVSFYTPEYAGELEPFTQSVVAAGHDVWPCALPSSGTWRLNCGKKPVFLMNTLLRVGRPVIWLDIDARMHGPFGLDLSEYDFAAYFIPNRLMHPNDVPGGASTGRDGIASGTMYFSTSEESMALLQAWADLEHGQHPCEQTVLGEVWYDHAPAGLRTYRLPQTHCKVFDQKWRMGEVGPAVIEHFQASRRLKRKV